MASDLPTGAEEEVWLQIHEDGTFVIDEAETGQVKSRIQDKIALLRIKKQSKFKK